MWIAPSPAQPTVSTHHSVFAQSAWDPYLSVNRPTITLRIGALPRRGYVITLTDGSARTISTPNVSVAEITRAIAGYHVLVRNGGFAVEFTPVDGVIHIKGGPLAGRQMEAYFAPEVLEAAVRGAGEI